MSCNDPRAKHPDAVMHLLDSRVPTGGEPEHDHGAALTEGATACPLVPAAQLSHDAREQAVSALTPFSSVGNWLFARDVPDDEAVVTIKTINNAPDTVLTRGHFKAASNARMALIKSRTPDVAETETASGDTEDDMQFAFRMVREFLDGLDREIKAQPSSELARGVALGVTFGVREYVSRMATIAAEKKQEHAR